LKCVQTVTGRIPLDSLGHCQLHEHLFVAPGPATERAPALLIDDPERSARELADYARAGGSCVLDAQPGGAGRNAAVLRDISLRTGVGIIAVTGYHADGFYREDDALLSAGADELADRFLRELREGCAEAPGVLPGAVKAALNRDGCRGRVRERFLAAARSAREAGVPLIVHTEAGAGAAEAAALALAEGLAAHRVVICHADRDADDFRRHEAIAETGVMLEYDTIHRLKYHDDASEIRLIRHMLERGCAGQLLLSLDPTRARLRSYGGDIGLDYILNAFAPALERSGIPAETIRRITRENPKRVFDD